MTEVQKAIVECPCGEQTAVSLAQAGIELRCRCGQASKIPPLSELRASRNESRVVKLQPVAPPPIDEDRSCVILMTNSLVLNQRMSCTALANFVAAIDREMDRFSAELDERGVDLQVAVALLPNHTCLLDLQVWSQETPQCDFQLLETRLKSLALPRVTGPAAFAMRRVLWNGASTPPRFKSPFADHFQGRSETLDQLLWHLAGRPVMVERDIHKEAPWWTRLWHAVIGWPSAVRGNSRQKVRDRVTSRQEPEGPIVLRDFVASVMQGHSEKRAGLLEESVKSFDRAIELCDQNADAYAARGDTHCRLGCFEKGLADLSRAIRLDPRHVEALAARGAVYLQLEAWDQALDDFRSADLVVSGREPHLHLGLARALAGKGDLPSALEACNHAFAWDPHNAEAHSLRAGIELSLIQGSLLAEDRIQQVLNDWSTALQIDPEHIGNRLLRADLLLRLDDAKGVLDDCDAALKLDPECGPAYGLRGIAWHRLGEFDRARDDCTQAINLQAASAAVYWTRAAIYKAEEQYESALLDCNLAQELEPDAPWVYNSRGTVRVAMNEVDAALDDFSTAIALAPAWGVPYGNRANMYRYREDYQRAIADYSKAIELDPELGMAHLNRALCWIDLEKYDQALSDLYQAAALLPDFAGTHFYRGQVFTLRGEYQRAIDAYDRVLELDPDCANAVYNRAQLHARLENEEAALEDFSKLIEEYPSMPVTYCARGNVWIQKGDFERGRRDFEHAISCAPDAAEELSIWRLLMEANYFFEHQDYGRCVERANDALAMNADCSPALRMRASAYWYSEQYVEAIDDYSALIADCGKLPDLLSSRGQVFAELGEFELAVSDLNEAIELAEEENLKVLRAYASNGRALANAGLGRYRESACDFERSVRLCPDNAWLYYNQALAYVRQQDFEKAAICFRLALAVEGVGLTPRKKERAEAFLLREDAAAS